MTTLTEFLLARIAEDEATAQVHVVPNRVATAIAPGVQISHNFGYAVDVATMSANAGRGISVQRDTSHLLAEVEAKRSIAELHQQDHDEPWCLEGCGMRAGAPEFPCDTLRTLASIWADHEDFRDEWR